MLCFTSPLPFWIPLPSLLLGKLSQKIAPLPNLPLPGAYFLWVGTHNRRGLLSWPPSLILEGSWPLQRSQVRVETIASSVDRIYYQFYVKRSGHPCVFFPKGLKTIVLGIFFVICMTPLFLGIIWVTPFSHSGVGFLPHFSLTDHNISPVLLSLPQPLPNVNMFVGVLFLSPIYLSFTSPTQWKDLSVNPGPFPSKVTRTTRFFENSPFSIYSFPPRVLFICACCLCHLINWCLCRKRFTFPPPYESVPSWRKKWITLLSKMSRGESNSRGSLKTLSFPFFPVCFSSILRSPGFPLMRLHSSSFWMR